MSNYFAEKRQRTAQFTQYLKLMRIRTQKMVKSDCFIIFNETLPDDVESPKIEELTAIKADCLASGGSSTSASFSTQNSSEDWTPDDSSCRYLQFAFGRDCFYMDLPRNAVFMPEVERILQERLGFFRARNRPDLPWVRANWEDVLEWNPLQKVYLYKDEESAAEDMAYIFFDVWKMPLDWPLYVMAAAFHTDHQFEWGKPLE